MSTEGIKWPEGFERADPGDRDKYGRFKVTRNRAFRSILREIGKWGGGEIEISTDAPHTQKNPNIPYAGHEPDDPGVVAYCVKDNQQYAFPCDTYNNLRDNARAIALYIDAKRTLERYGVGSRIGEWDTQALPPGDEEREKVVAREPPHVVLGVDKDAPEAVIKGAARGLKADLHPDQGGDQKEFDRVNKAEDRMLKERGH